MRIRLTFAKTDAMRFTSHLDVHRTLERTMRRANLPLTYSQGFNPRPKINLASALPLGFTSECEVADMRLDETMSLGSIVNAIRETSPRGIELIEVEEVDQRDPTLQTLLRSTEYIVTLNSPVIDLDERIQRLLDAEVIYLQRRRKKRMVKYDLRPLIEGLYCLPDDEDGRQRMHMRLSSQAGATGRADEVLKAMEFNPHEAHVHRTELIFD
jgi:radical SAM-linked protein